MRREFTKQHFLNICRNAFQNKTQLTGFLKDFIQRQIEQLVSKIGKDLSIDTKRIQLLCILWFLKKSFFQLPW